MWLPLKIGLTLAGVVGVASITAVACWTIFTDDLPEYLTLKNESGPAECVVTFERGNVVKVVVSTNEVWRKFFLTGVPPVHSVACASNGEPVIVVRQSACMRELPDYYRLKDSRGASRSQRPGTARTLLFNRVLIAAPNGAGGAVAGF
jgi:hypothetical protein